MSEPGTCDLFTADEDPPAWLPEWWLWRHETTPSGWRVSTTTFTLNGFYSIELRNPWGELVWQGVQR